MAIALRLRAVALQSEIYIACLEPGQIELTMSEIENGCAEFTPRMLQNNQVFEL